jgi:predicted RNA-binding protein YlqC (UPF0109 family)
VKKLIEYLVKNIVNLPDSVSLEEKTENGFSSFYLKTAPEDIGKVIGKKGKTIKAIRSLLYLKGIIKQKKAGLYLVESNETTL